MNRVRDCVLLALAASSGGCGYELSGWWTLARWDVEWAEGAASVQDAGVMSWQDAAGAGEFDFALSYAFDPESRTFVPLAEPSEGGVTPADGVSGTYQGEDPVLMTVFVDPYGVQQQLVLTMDRHVGDRMVLQGLAGDTTVRWTFVR